MDIYTYFFKYVFIYEFQTTNVENRVLINHNLLHILCVNFKVNSLSVSTMSVLQYIFLCTLQIQPVP